MFSILPIALPPPKKLTHTIALMKTPLHELPF